MTISSNLPPSAAADRVPMQTLGQQEFLQLLVAQLTAQDPLNPRKDTEFIAQMAQFSALEQSKTMQSDLAQLRAEQKFMQAYALMGRTVDLRDGENVLEGGAVSAVQIEAGTPKLVVNGQRYDLSQVLRVTHAPA